MSELRKLNAYESVVNTVSGEELFELIAKTCGEIFAHLSVHSGPEATNALLVIEQDLGNFNPAVYTKDGIDILNAIEYISPIQTYIKSQIGYIGSRVDSAAHDGTTTSMLIATALIGNLSQNINSVDKKTIKYMFSDMRRQLQQSKLTIDDYAEDKDIDLSTAQGELAYIQTMITSKGDKELAEAMQEIFEKTPRDMYSYFAYHLSQVESEKNFTVKNPDGEYMIDIIPASNAKYNHALGSEYLYENCDLIVLPEELVAGYVEVDVLLKYLEKTTVPTVILFKKVDGSMITTFNKINTYTDIVPVKYIDRLGNRLGDGGLPIELEVLNAVAGKKSIDKIIDDTEYNNPDIWIIKNVKINITNTHMFINNLYSCESEDQFVHPWYSDPEANQHYTKLVTEIKEHIHKLQNTHQRDTRGEIQIYVKALRDMIGNRTPLLEIGGNTMDIRANESVVKDVLGSITSTLEDGFLIDGNMVMYDIATELGLSEFVECILTIYETILPGWEYADVVKMINSFRKHHQYTRRKKIHYKTLNIKYSKEYLSGNFDVGDDTDIVIQPIVMYDELFRRLNEVIPKLINTSKIIVPGTANIKDERRNS